MLTRTSFLLYKGVVGPQNQPDYAHGLRQIPLDVPQKNILRKSKFILIGNDMTSRHMTYER